MNGLTRRFVRGLKRGARAKHRAVGHKPPADGVGTTARAVHGDLAVVHAPHWMYRVNVGSGITSPPRTVSTMSHDFIAFLVVSAHLVLRSLR